MIITSEYDPCIATCQEKKVVIQVEGLAKRYGKLVAVKGIDFTVRQGEIFGLIGPDGAGKTTTFHILGGVTEASEGQIEVLGNSPRDARLFIGYVPEQLSLYLDLSVDENLEYSAGLRQVSPDLFQELRSKYLDLMGLEKCQDRLAKNLSGGMKRKLALCCVLVSQPQILLLDEPTTGVDPVSRREFWDDLAAIAAEGVTIVVATPYLDEAERCSRIALIQEGEIQQIGTLSQLRDSLGCKRLEVRTNQIEVANDVLRAQLVISNSQIIDVQTFGDRLDILVKNVDLGQPEVRKILNQHQLESNNIKISEPTLENVFVTSLRSLGNDPEFLPFPRIKSSSKDLATQENRPNKIAISTEKLSKRFGNFQAVKGIDLEIRYGEIYGLLGANGAGKTTTIKMLCGLLSSTSGTITLAGETGNLRSRELRQRIGYMSQKFTLYDDLTIVENLEFYCGVYGVPREFQQQKINWVLATCGLVGKEKLLTGKLPGGWKQRVAFGASVMHEPEILFLDEPTSGVDPLARRQ
ncbi:MAG: ATP-binding cassette domain-containing protein, partial [Xenococcus sp. (in: cyanobacteria)]